MNRTEQDHSEIRATDLALLMGVVGAAAGLYNALEAHEPIIFRAGKPWVSEFDELGVALRDLGTTGGDVSQYSEIMDELGALREQNDWLVKAVKHLLGNEVGWQEPVPRSEVDLDLDDEDWQVPVHAPKAPAPAVCPHNQQVLVGSDTKCARCGITLIAGGVVGRNARPGSAADHFAVANKG